MLFSSLVMVYLVAEYRRYAPPAIQVTLPYLGITPPVSLKDCTELRIVSCNIQGIPAMQNLSAVRRFLHVAKSQADIICLQEVFSHSALDACSKSLIGWYTCGPEAYASGLFIASRYKLHNIRALHFSKGRWVDRLVSKGALRASVQVCGARLDFATVHLQSDYLLASQFGELLSFIGSDPCFVAGDFNISPEIAKPLLGLSAKIHRCGMATHEEGELDYGVELNPAASQYRCRGPPRILGPQPADHAPLSYVLTSQP